MDLMFGQQQPAAQYRPVPNHPYASYATQTVPGAGLFIHCACRACGDQSTKRCMSPARVSYWVLQYATLHGHGLTPQRTR